MQYGFSMDQPIDSRIFRRKYLAMAISLVGLSACVSAPDLGAGPQPVDPSEIAADKSFQGHQADWPEDAWWVIYDEPQLAALIEKAIENSPDMKIAAARIERAEALALRAASAGGFSWSLNGDANLTKQSYNNGFPKEFLPQGWNDHGNLAFGGRYDFDLWGRTKSELAAATSDLLAAEYDAQQSKLLLTTSLAAAYVDLASLYIQQDFRKEALAIREASRELVALRVENGLDREGNLRLADANVASAKANLASTDETIALKKNELALLVGEGPDAALQIERPNFGDVKGHGVPVDAQMSLVGRRPDIAAARVRIEAESAREDRAHADYFPSIQINGLVGLQALGLADLISTDSLYGNVGPAISLPIFQHNTLEAGLRSARAGYDEAAARYDDLVLSAYRNVADIVTSQNMLGQRLALTDEAVEASQDAYEIAQLRYKGGLSTYVEVLTIEERALEARQARSALDARAMQLDIALVRELGGGFTATQTEIFADFDAQRSNSDG